MDETITPRARRAAVTPSGPRGRRRWATLLAVSGLAALLAWNTVSASTETATAAGERIVRLPGGDIHVEQDGPPGAPTVVLLHGLAGSTAWWEPVLPALRDQHVVRVDLLGHGGSAKPAGGYGIAEQARRIGTVLDRLEVRRATVVGHSTGGAVAASLAEQRRDLVTRPPWRSAPDCCPRGVRGNRSSTSRPSRRSRANPPGERRSGGVTRRRRRGGRAVPG